MPAAAQLLESARDHHRAGRLTEAEVLYRRAAESDPANPAAPLDLGTVLHDQGRLDEAAAVLGQLVVDQPDLSAGWVQLGRVVAAGGFHWEAHRAIVRALRGTPDTDTLLAAASVLLSLQDGKAAEAACRLAVDQSPSSALAWIQLARALTVRGRHAPAVDALNRALKLDPENDTAKFLHAILCPGRPTSAPAATTAPPQEVRALFDNVAQRFDALLVGQLQYHTPQLLARMLAEHLARRAAKSDSATAPMTMLDAGCGTGLCGPLLSQHRGQLIGIDLSPAMLHQARSRNIYDQLILGELINHLQTQDQCLDLIIAADVLVYLGDLTALFPAVARALRPAGIFLFSVERSQAADYELLPTQRFAHSVNYLQRLAAAAGLHVCRQDQVVLRQDRAADVRGHLLLMEKPSAAVPPVAPITPA